MRLESPKSGMNSARVDVSYRWSMSWFIFSEVMFFAAFFGALFYARVISLPWLGDLDHKQYLWPDFGASWPNLGPAALTEAVPDDGPVADPDDQHRVAACVRRHA